MGLVATKVGDGCKQMSSGFVVYLDTDIEVALSWKELHQSLSVSSASLLSLIHQHMQSDGSSPKKRDFLNWNIIEREVSKLRQKTAKRGSTGRPCGLSSPIGSFICKQCAL